jgi:hypothetical protein
MCKCERERERVYAPYREFTLRIPQKFKLNANKFSEKVDRNGFLAATAQKNDRICT